ncbi:MAG: hypothetical protein N4A72_10430 [Bacteroidales bacterium]|jgi:lipopolysaccharide export system permease protein|nr:hypothetical protein [Bacteroidales bacterium]
MKNATERLKKLDDTKLKDVVKNYRQYGYNEEIRDTAIEILKERGHDMESLKLSGNLENKSYNQAEQYFKSFDIQSKLAFMFYALILIVRILMPTIIDNTASVQLIIVAVFWISLIGFFVTLIKSFLSQAKYYKQIDKQDNQLNPALFFTLGMALYIVMYFVFRKQMKEDINLIR